ncbi:MAG: EAL domain-containing protein, partial [Planctomycetota bacterium]
PESMGKACADISDAIGTLEGGIVCLYDPSHEFDFRAARAAGAQQFVAYPAPSELVLCTLQGMNQPEAPTLSAPCSTGIVPLDIFHRQVERAISEARAKERHVALVCLGMADGGEHHSWAGMEACERGDVEKFLQRALQITMERRPANGSVLDLNMQDFRLTWMRPDRAVILIPNMRRVQDIAKLGAGMQESLLELAGEPGARYFDNVSMGVALCPGDSTGAVGLVECALETVDRARADGNPSMSFCTESMGLWAFERLTLEDSLYNALRNNEFRVHYQPRVDAHTKEILGVEALVRWVHPQLGMVSPAQFIPLAEETGLIVPIGEWVLREACRQNQAWRNAGYKPIRVSVNLSPVQFRDTNLNEVVDSALQESGLATDGLELEVTESMLMNDPDETIRVLKRLKNRGLKISIDDFGTGYSSLSYLKQFPIDSLKIDRSFIRDVTTNSDDAAITTAVILMGHSLKLNVVAEGVETESQLAFLQVLRGSATEPGLLFASRSRPTAWNRC